MNRPRDVLSAVLWTALFVAVIASAAVIASLAAELAFGAVRCAEQVEVCIVMGIAR